VPEKRPRSHDDNDPAKIVKANIRGKKYVEFIPHAIEQMAIRCMTEKEAIEALGDPDEIKDSTVAGRKVAMRNHTALWKAKIIFEELEDRLRVITVIWVKRRLSGR
jgi:hypothetical protein